MPQQLPAVSLVAVPGRRRATLEVALYDSHGKELTRESLYSDDSEDE